MPSDTTAKSPKNAPSKLLLIRGDLQGLFYKEDWSAIVGMIRGISLADPDLAISVIEWKNPHQTNQPTLLHDLLTMPSREPPLSLVKMLLDTCPRVLHVPNAAGHVPLHVAIYNPTTTPGKQQSSLALIRLLIQADKQQLTLTPVTFWQAIRRQDEQVIRLLLKFQKCRKALTLVVNGRIPLYYLSSLSGEDEISPLLQLIITCTVEELKKSPCCMYRAVELVSDYCKDGDALLDICARDKLYCTNHLIDVARRNDLASHEKKKKTQTKIDARIITLPPKRLGVSFKGTPPVVTRIADDSPVKEDFSVGLTVDRVVLPDGAIHTQFSSATELVSILGDTLDMVGRTMTLYPTSETTKEQTKNDDELNNNNTKELLQQTIVPTSETETTVNDESNDNKKESLQEETVPTSETETTVNGEAKVEETETTVNDEAKEAETTTVAAASEDTPATVVTAEEEDVPEAAESIHTAPTDEVEVGAESASDKAADKEIGESNGCEEDSEDGAASSNAPITP